MGSATIGVILGDGSVAYPGDQIEMVDPFTRAADLSPWTIVQTTPAGLVATRDFDFVRRPIFGGEVTRLGTSAVVSTKTAGRLRPWKSS